MAWNEASPALRRYAGRVGSAMCGYVVVLVAADVTIRRVHPAGVPLYLLAILPALPILAVFVALARYVAEESDEYLRARLVRQLLYATGLTMMVSTVWGFLSALADVPPLQHVPVLFFAALGVAAILLWIEER